MSLFPVDYSEIHLQLPSLHWSAFHVSNEHIFISKRTKSLYFSHISMLQFTSVSAETNIISGCVYCRVPKNNFSALHIVRSPFPNMPNFQPGLISFVSFSQRKERDDRKNSKKGSKLNHQNQTKLNCVIVYFCDRNFIFSYCCHFADALPLFAYSHPRVSVKLKGTQWSKASVTLHFMDCLKRDMNSC